MSPSFRVYTSDDIIGVELGGTLKNIIALGAGISDGLEMGQNSKSTLITRGLAEMSRLGIAAGGPVFDLCRAGRAGRPDGYLLQRVEPQPLCRGTVGPGPHLAGNPGHDAERGGGSQYHRRGPGNGGKAWT